MKVVLDTNVLVSGIFFSGPPYKILQAWRDGKIQLAASEEILQEYSRVGEILTLDHSRIDLKPWIEFIVTNATIFASVSLSSRVCDDPDDDKFLACALASGARVIASGDKHLLKVSGYKGIEVLKPREFVERYLA